MAMTIDEYMENLKNPKHLDDIQRLRTYLKEQLPEATETMQYSMPTYEQNGQVIASLASQKNYISLYMDMDVVEQHRDELGKLDCGKSCIRFKRADQLPLDVISTILRESVAKVEND